MPTTVTFNLVDVLGPSPNAIVRLDSKTTPFIDGSGLVVSGTRKVQCNSLGVGVASVEPGIYYVTFRNVVGNRDQLIMVVPEGDGAALFTSLITAFNTCPALVITGSYATIAQGSKADAAYRACFSPSGGWRIGIDDDGNIFPVQIT